jgi:hypothetical protein
VNHPGRDGLLAQGSPTLGHVVDLHEHHQLGACEACNEQVNEKHTARYPG